ncbi:MAG: hypothetical protein A3F12_02050 [Gammaproteobacteria bacterium RIFCSPHIGHO2_12_FULL_38_14]|nr:MAG: hypothetical protein A3F12_02050 [Gammaproteobacteria bacterium RIFCSPHIGHO2_12_FULL_38_14]
MDFNFLRKEKTLPGLCSIYLLPNKCIVTHALTDRETPTITLLEIVPYQFDSLGAVLSSVINKNKLDNVVCTWALHSGYYQLFLLDPPAIAETEMSFALRWQIKELINFKAEEAAIEYFAVPAVLEAKKKIYVAAAKMQELQKIADIICDAGLKLKYIDIAELCLRNINALYGDDQCYLGLLAFDCNAIEFIITHEKNLLLSRRLSFPDTMDLAKLSAEWLNELTTEIKNSFSYCKSQQQKELPAKLLVSTANVELIAQFNQLLQIETELLEMHKKINFEFMLPQNDYTTLDYLIAIGSVLRKSHDHARN